MIGAGLDPETLSPYAALYSERYNLLCMLYQPLVLTVGNQQYNVMITGYDEVETGVYEVHLYDNIYDTAGNHFTASDAVFSYNLAKESGNFSKLNAASFEAKDDTTLVIKFDDSMLSGQINSVLSQIFMITEAAYNASSDQMLTDAVGTTGYVVSDFMEGSYIVFEKAPNGYWQTASEGEEGYVAQYDATKLDIVQYDFIGESSQMAIALQSGDIDIADRVSTIDAVALEKSDNVNITKNIGEHYSATYNCAETSEMQNENMRKAISYSWDANGIVQGAFNGEGEAATALNNVYRLDYNPKYNTEDYYGYNMDAAKKYLAAYEAETGKSASDVTITILCTNTEYLEKVAQIMQTYILKLGVNCEVTSYDNATRKSIRNSREGWDIAIAASTAVDLYCVDTFSMQYNRDTGKSLAGGWIDDDTLHTLMLAAVSPETHSMDTMTEFEDYMRERCYAMGICIDRVYAGSSRWVTELAEGAYGYASPCASTYDWSAK